MTPRGLSVLIELSHLLQAEPVTEQLESPTTRFQVQLVFHQLQPQAFNMYRPIVNKSRVKTKKPKVQTLSLGDCLHVACIRLVTVYLAKVIRPVSAFQSCSLWSKFIFVFGYVSAAVREKCYKNCFFSTDASMTQQHPFNMTTLYFIKTIRKCSATKGIRPHGNQDESHEQHSTADSGFMKTYVQAVTLSKISLSQRSLQKPGWTLIRVTALQSASLSARAGNLIKCRPMLSHIISKRTLRLSIKYQAKSFLAETLTYPLTSRDALSRFKDVHKATAQRASAVVEAQLNNNQTKLGQLLKESIL